MLGNVLAQFLGQFGSTGESASQDDKTEDPLSFEFVWNPDGGRLGH